MIVTNSALLVASVIVVGMLEQHAVAHAQQLPLTLQRFNSSWNVPPPTDESGHLVFNSASSYLQHWPNTRYRNGHSIVPGYITPGTLLYHGDHSESIPPGPEWCSFDFEHSYMFGNTMQTYAVSGPGRGLRVLYLDGSSAAKMQSGPMDTQVLLVHGKLTDDGWSKEFSNIYDLCKWAKPYGVGGIVRMEFDFELMLCDFTNGVKLVSSLPLLPVKREQGGPGLSRGDAPYPGGDDLVSEITAAHPRFDSPNHTFPTEPGPGPSPPRRGPRPPEVPPPKGWIGSLRQSGAAVFEAIQAGNWHNNAPGVSGVDLDYSSAISLFHPKYSSLVAARRKIEQREVYRAGNISLSDMITVFSDLDEVLKRDQGPVGAGVKWADVIRSVKERHSQRLEYLDFTLRQNITATHSINTTVSRARDQVLMILSPFLINTPIPSLTSGRDEWLVAPMHHCTNTFTGHISEDYLTPQEKIIKHGIEVVMREVCRTMGALWLDAFEAEEASSAEQKTLVKRWTAEVKRLMAWLGWAEWTKCEPECGPTEMCSLPQWPFDMGRPGPSGPGEDQERQNNYTPRCMDRIAAVKGGSGFPGGPGGGRRPE